jgi:hypothetical protein
MRRGAGRCHRLFVSRALTASKEGEPAAVKEVGAAFGTRLDSFNGFDRPSAVGDLPVEANQSARTSCTSSPFTKNIPLLAQLKSPL